MSSKVPRTKNMMYVNQLKDLDPQMRKLIINHHGDQKWFNEHNGWYDCQPLLNYLLSLPQLKGDHIAVIVHDRDYQYDKDGQIVRDENGKPVIVAPHVHIGRGTPKPSAITVLCHAMNDDKTEHVEAFNKKGKGRRKVTDESNMFSYLYHRTFKAQQLGKFQYAFADGNANFDIEKMIKEATVEAAKVREQKEAEQQRAEDKDSLETFINQILMGEINLADRFSDPLLQRVYAKNKAPLDNAQEEYTETVVKLSELLKQAILTNQNGKNDQRIAELKKEIKRRHGNTSQGDNYYITGAAGSGKTVLAQLIGGTYDDDNKPRGVYLATGDKHQMDGYQGEYAIVLDDVRPKTYPPEMLLTVLDNNQTAKVLDARYKRKLTANLKCVVTTNTMSLAEFVRFIPDKTDTGDAESQYFRRFRDVFIVGKPEQSIADSNNFIVKFKRYRVKRIDGFGYAYDNGTYLKELEAEKRRGKDKFIALPIYRDNGNGFVLDHYSDFYLSQYNGEKGEGQITVPFNQLDKDIKPKEERLKMDNMLAKKTRESVNSETLAATGIDFSDMSDEDRKAAYEIGKEKVERERNAEPIKVKQQKKEITPDNVISLNDGPLPWE